MKLRQKSILLTALTLGGATLIMLGVVRFVALRKFDLVEEQNARRATTRLQKLVGVELDDLTRSVRDYGLWVDLNEALMRGDEAFFGKNIPYEVAANLRWSLFLAVRNDGRVVFAHEIEENAKTFLPMTPAHLAALQKMLAAPHALDAGHICRIEGELFLVATAPVKSFRPDSPLMGRLLIARRVSQREIARLSQMADLPVGIEIVDTTADETIPTDVEISRPSASAIIASTVLHDETAAPVAVLRVSLDTAVHEQGQKLSTLLVWMLLAEAVLACALIDFLVLRRIIARLARMSAGLKNVQRSGDLQARLPVGGKDEISSLAQEANRLLASVASSQRTLERVNAEMQQRVAERTTALADANAALEADIAERIKAEQERERLREQLVQAQKMEAVGTLAGGIAHDFNNILTGILGHAELLRGALPVHNTAKANLDHIVAAAERAASLVKQILAFSRQTPGERQNVHVNQVAREALALLRAALPSGIEIRCQTRTAEDVINADPTQLHQIFMNLGANAGHAMGSRPGELAITIDRLTLKAEQIYLTGPLPVGNYVRIDIRDTGCGMTPEVMNRIFDPFFSTKPVNEGTGLGLAVVHGIVAEHGGAIDVESTVGIGTCFTLLLPAADSPATPATRAAVMPAIGHERVLLVDDEEMVLSVLAKNLERLGYTVTALAGAPEALERFRMAPRDFDLVITDQTMPQLSGLEFAAALRAIRADVPVILATGYSPDTAGREAATLGLAGIVGKPIDFAELTRLMRQALNQARSEQLAMTF